MKAIAEEDIQKQETVPVRNKRILIIDDNEDLIEVFETILEMNDFVVLTARGGAEALSLLLGIGKLDLILLDMQMEEMSGPEFLKLFEKSQPKLFESVPVVFLSGMDKIPQSKAVGFIRKPLADIDTFLETVDRFIEVGNGLIQYKH